jgi:hypothetical protein
MGVMGSISKWSVVRKQNAIGLILLVVASIPLWVALGLPMPISYTTQGLYDAIVKLPKGSIVCFGWQAVKFEQYQGQETTAAALFKLMHSRGLKVVCFSLGGLAPLFFEDIYRRNRLVELYGLKYGEDYVITPFVAGEETALAAFAKDTWATISTDIYGNPVKELPLMQRCRTGNDIALGIMSSYSWSNYDQYIRQWGHAFKIPLVQVFHSFNPIAYAYPWPVVGALDGDRGNAEFEYLSGFPGAALARLEAANMINATLICMLVGGMLIRVYGSLRKVPKLKEEAKA